MSSTIVSTASYAAAAARPSSPAKYVPVHKRTPSDIGSTLQRSSSPVPSESTTTSSSSSHSRVYSIAELLDFSREPEVKAITVEQREKLKKELPEIVMSRKMRKATEYHMIQERVRANAVAHAQAQLAQVTKPKNNLPAAATQQPRQRPGQRRMPRTVGRRNATKIVDEASWRALRPGRVIPGVPQSLPISAA